MRHPRRPSRSRNRSSMRTPTPSPRSKPMRDKRNFKTPKLDWPGGVVPEWARPQGDPNKRRRAAKGGKGGGGGGGGGGGAKRERLQKVMAQSGYGSRRNIE